MTTQKKVQTTKVSLAIFQAFHGLSALVGGFGLIGDPSGGNLGMDAAWLSGSPFNDFLIPGLFLLIVNGLGNLGGFFTTVREHRRAGEIGLFFGAVMVAWILVQGFLIGYRSFLQPLYLGTGALQAVLGYFFLTQLKKAGKNQA